MSTYIVSAETLAGATRAVIENTRSLTMNSYEIVAASLYKLNRHAVAKRYGEKMDNRALLPEGFESYWKTIFTLGEKEIANYLDELWYQCSEGLDPLYQDAYKELVRIRTALAKKGLYKNHEG